MKQPLNVVQNIYLFIYLASKIQTGLQKIPILEDTPLILGTREYEYEIKSEKINGYESIHPFSKGYESIRPEPESDSDRGIPGLKNYQPLVILGISGN